MFNEGVVAIINAFGLGTQIHIIYDCIHTLTFFLFLYFAFTQFLAGDLISAWVLAWWKRAEIAVEWTKAKTYRFYVTERKKGHDEFRVLTDGRPIEMRREAVGTGPHKIQMFLFTSEFGAVVNPTEINGERYYHPSDSKRGLVFNGEFIEAVQPTPEDYSRFNQLKSQKELGPLAEGLEKEYSDLVHKIEVWNNSKTYVAYPSHAVTPDEFVRYQEINTDPATTETYSEMRELETQKDMMNPYSSLSQNAHWLIPLIFVLAIAYQIVGQQSMCAASAGQVLECSEQLRNVVSNCSIGGIPGGVDALPPIQNTSVGGFMK